jgi:hypothetical protein
MERDDHGETRQERRERKLKARREQMPKHGAGLRQSFVDAALKMARKRLKRTSRRR